MATSPQPPRPPTPPPPPRTGSHLVAIALLFLALIVLVAGMALWVGVRYLSHAVKVQVQEGASGRREVAIQTPLGSLEVQGDVNEARLGLPIYPGATRVRDKGSATVSLDFPGDEAVRIVAAKFETPDSLEKVKAFYKDRLGNEVTKYVEKTQEGKTVFEMKGRGQDKVVALEEKGTGTVIALVRVTHGAQETN
jgi:hypothetical protein